MPIGKMIHALSRSTSSECLHFLPFRSLRPSRRSPLSLSRRDPYVALAALQAALLFLSDEFNSCRRSANALSIFPTSAPTSGSIRISISMRATPESIRSPPFNITRVPAPFLSAVGCVPTRQFEPRVEKASPYLSFPSDCTRYGRKSRIIVGGTRTVAAPRVSPKSITSLFSPS